MGFPGLYMQLPNSAVVRAIPVTELRHKRSWKVRDAIEKEAMSVYNEELMLSANQSHKGIFCMSYSQSKSIIKQPGELVEH